MTMRQRKGNTNYRLKEYIMEEIRLSILLTILTFLCSCVNNSNKEIDTMSEYCTNCLSLKKVDS